MTQTTNQEGDQNAAGDNLFGICAAVGREFGFNPLWLRLAFAVTFLASPEMVAGTYFALGAVVLVARLLAPRRLRGIDAAPIAKVEPAAGRAVVEEPATLPLAA